MNELVDALKDKDFSNMGQDQVLKTCLLLIGKDTTFELKILIKEYQRDWRQLGKNYR